MFNLITIAVGLLAVVATSVGATLTNAGSALPNVAVIFAVYAAVHRDAFGALLTAFVVGIVGGITLGAGRGVVLLSLLLVVGSTRWARTRLPLNRRLVMAGWVAAAAVLADLGFVILGFLLLPDLRFGATLLRVTPLSALVTAVAAIPTFVVLGWIEPLLRARQERSTLFS